MQHLSARMLYASEICPCDMEGHARWQHRRILLRGWGLGTTGLVRLRHVCKLRGLDESAPHPDAGHWPGTLTLRGAMASFRDKQWCASFCPFFLLLLLLYSVFGRLGSVQEQHVQEGRPHRGTVVLPSRARGMLVGRWLASTCRKHQSIPHLCASDRSISMSSFPFRGSP